MKFSLCVSDDNAIKKLQFTVRKSLRVANEINACTSDFDGSQIKPNLNVGNIQRYHSQHLSISFVAVFS